MVPLGLVQRSPALRCDWANCFRNAGTECYRIALVDKPFEADVKFVAHDPSFGIFQFSQKSDLVIVQLSSTMLSPASSQSSTRNEKWGFVFTARPRGNAVAGCYQQLDGMGTEQEHGVERCLVHRCWILTSKEEVSMMKIAFIAAAAVAVLTTAPVITPVKAQGVDVQLGRDRDRDDGYRHRRDSDVTVGVGPGGITVGPRRNCRMVTTTVERDDGRMITRKERRCD
jgi:hypothetical protein